MFDSGVVREHGGGGINVSEIINYQEQHEGERMVLMFSLAALDQRQWMMQE